MPRQPAAARVEAVRRFSRFYTRRLGVLREHLLDGPLTLTQGRVLFEVAQRDDATASAIGRELDLDAGHLSRTLTALQRQRLVERRAAARDGRQRELRLTTAGRRLFARLDARSRQQVSEMLRELGPSDQRRLIEAMETIRVLLGDREPDAPPYLLRPHRPGDFGWIVSRHGALYAQEHGWDGTMEQFAAEICARIMRDFDPARECCVIAERHGDNVGSICVVRGDAPDEAKLRLLLVEPEARGFGIGGRLVDEAIRFSREKGYRRLVLWTSDNLVAARRLYERAGFHLEAESPEHRFGKDLVFQTWALDLRSEG